jgi:hypothetical protein
VKIFKKERDPPLFTSKQRGGSLSFLVGTISNVLVMEIGWTDVGSGRYILVSCAHSNTSLFWKSIYSAQLKLSCDIGFVYRRTDGHGETSIPPYNFVAGSIITKQEKQR